MKYLLTLALTGVFYLSATYASYNYEETLAWEEAAESFLNVSDLEIFNLSVVGNKVTFEYDKEFYQPFVIATFECEGTGYYLGGQARFQTLNCVEKEPTLWDEY